MHRECVFVKLCVAVFFKGLASLQGITISCILFLCFWQWQRAHCAVTALVILLYEEVENDKVFVTVNVQKNITSLA